MAEETRPLPKIDTSVPHSARVWNCLLGGKDHYPVDRALAEQINDSWPGLGHIARTSRHFLGRAVGHLAAEAGVRQFLDVGTGLPTVDNTHELAQRIAPESKVVYVDNDPLVLVHAHALLTSTPEGTTDYIEADMRETGRILTAAARTLDLSRPVALIMMGVLGHIPDYDEALSIVRRLVGGLPSGSHLLAYDGTDTSPEAVTAQDDYNASGTAPYFVRGPEQITRFFDGLDILDPGVTMVTRWRPENSPFPPAYVDAYGGVGRKP